MGQVIRGLDRLAVPGGSGGSSPQGLASGSGYLHVSPATATYNDFNPGAPWPKTAILDITPIGGDVTLTGLLAGTNFQMVLIRNSSGASNVLLDSENAGSLAANRFSFAGNLGLPPGENVIVVYSSDLSRWLIA